MPPGPPFPGSRGTPNVAKSAVRGCVNFFPEINFGVSTYDLFLVVYKGGLFTLRPFFNPFQRYENFVFGQKKNCHISETKRFDPLKSNSPLYKPHQMGPFQERNFFFFELFSTQKKADFATIQVPRLPEKGPPGPISGTAIPFYPLS